MLPSLLMLVKVGLLQDVKLFELNYACKDIAGLYDLARYHMFLCKCTFYELSYESITLSVLVCFDVLFLILVQIEVFDRLSRELLSELLPVFACVDLSLGKYAVDTFPVR